MTGDIRKILEASEAVESLRMEGLVADCFRSRGWPAEQGVYFADVETGKSREIDVFCRHVLDRPKRIDITGKPLINLLIFCECKSLSSWNVIFTKKENIEFYENRLRDHWIGSQNFTRDAVENINSQGTFKRLNRARLFSYFSERAHPDETQLTYLMRLSPPPVDMIATAFRATKSGKDEREKINPIWSAIQSVSSAVRSAELHSEKSSKSYFDIAWNTSNAREDIINISYFYDVELARRVLFHPVIFCKSRLFNIDDMQKEIRSARIFIRNIDFDFYYVDLVNYNFAEEYIETMLSNFQKQSYKAIRKTWDRLEALGWQPGQSANTLAKALGVVRTTSKKDQS